MGQPAGMESVLRGRYRRIVFFFARVIASFIGWEVVGRRVGLGRLADRTRARRLRATAVRFRALAISMGGLMIKVGQFLSARLDVLPPEVTAELSGLQDEVPPEEFAAIRAVTDGELTPPLSGHFASFETEAAAAASLGQVHRAHLHDADAARAGFRDVVVKIQRPHIEQVIEVDLSALRRVAGWLARYRPIADRTDVLALVEEFAVTTRAEVDYLAEARNAETFAANFAEDPRVEVPRVVWELTTRRVLTLEDVSAIKVGDHEGIAGAGIDRAEVARVLAETYLQQIFADSFFHADPHPGNLFVTPLHHCADAVTARYVLWTMREPDAALRAWRELLRPGGTLVIVDGLWFPDGLPDAGLPDPGLADAGLPDAAGLADAGLSRQTRCDDTPRTCRIA